VATERQLAVVIEQLLAPSGLIARITELELRTRSSSLASLLSAFPKQLQRLNAMGYPYPIISLVRGLKGLDATIEVEAGGLEDMLEQLNALKPTQFASLNFVLATNGFFTKKSRPVAEKAARKALARFKNTKLTSVHPK
jgi:hypothetical protein